MGLCQQTTPERRENNKNKRQRSKESEPCLASTTTSAGKNFPRMSRQLPLHWVTPRKCGMGTKSRKRATTIGTISQRNSRRRPEFWVTRKKTGTARNKRRLGLPAAFGYVAMRWQLNCSSWYQY